MPWYGKPFSKANIGQSQKCARGVWDNGKLRTVLLTATHACREWNRCLYHMALREWAAAYKLFIFHSWS